MPDSEQNFSGIESSDASLCVVLRMSLNLSPLSVLPSCKWLVGSTLHGIKCVRCAVKTEHSQKMGADAVEQQQNELESPYKLMITQGEQRSSNWLPLRAHSVHQYRSASLSFHFDNCPWFEPTKLIKRVRISPQDAPFSLANLHARRDERRDENGEV